LYPPPACGRGRGWASSACIKRNASTLDKTNHIGYTPRPDREQARPASPSLLWRLVHRANANATGAGCGFKVGRYPQSPWPGTYRASTGSWLPSASSRCEQRPARTRAATPVPGHDRHKWLCRTSSAHPATRTPAEHDALPAAPVQAPHRSRDHPNCPNTAPPRLQIQQGRRPLPPARSPRAQSRGPFVSSEVETQRPTCRASNRAGFTQRRGGEGRRRDAALFLPNHNVQSRCAAVRHTRPLRALCSPPRLRAKPLIHSAPTPPQTKKAPGLPDAPF